LKSLDAEVVRVSAGALAKLPAAEELAEVIAAIAPSAGCQTSRPLYRPRRRRVAARTPIEGETRPRREGVVRLVHSHTPHARGEVERHRRVRRGAWAKRKAAIPWEAGDATAGRPSSRRRRAPRVTTAGGATGPSLLGVAKRFGRDDLLTSIIDPNKDVSRVTAPTRVTTTDGKAYLGMIVYEAVDGVILQTGAETTVRVAGENIESKKTVDTSLMPAGLLDKLTDREVADLMAYLRLLGDK